MITSEYYDSTTSDRIATIMLPCEDLNLPDDETNGSLSALKPPPEFYDPSDYSDSDGEISQQQEDVVIA